MSMALNCNFDCCSDVALDVVVIEYGFILFSQSAAPVQECTRLKDGKISSRVPARLFKIALLCVQNCSPQSIGVSDVNPDAPHSAALIMQDHAREAPAPVGA